MTRQSNNQWRVRKMTDDDIDQVLAWRNHDEVRSYMHTQHEITRTEHARWFEQASADPRRALLIFESQGIALGYVNFHQTAQGRTADWGFYAAPDAPKGTGRAMGQAALHYGFTELNLHKVCGQVLAYNERSLRMHCSLGFQQEGVLREQHFDGQSYHDTVCFGLLAAEWQLNT
ncbi:UDP-4-amino-4,6-dideoxy-N-acetyl-beta-L-altrosamine N-acetyltransferase [Pseudomonas chlororaphis]|uniref:UDP-4-amino-4, 6-dideoxy-N-acetyl-beta-L-altrosamine N-acetyltransferase n=1 Tax=Pseudomonas chlororaphis TaxID=587753 RepID=UPI00209B3F8D|nr:UDP-4-amino-4,6-dideoxy-N-acetyl-beta-L-altrosamine N-acetyltransferase [Pseudomonas chlororaphis]MCO7570710.1 UDP-4-amino-4,6-dideoxy-N-acetyl-beta-L-altrosamine N-acetyltransferase [Pseudomonas chlororaphis]MCO7588770.1 UDP-4-amino-4,6-dideoxy-N-acetyl-beta-L-altrosamine N-acetyltransferase [Pseudomonas chlororaphis]